MRAHTDYSYTKTIWLFDFSIALRAWWSHTSDSIHSYGFGSIQFLSFARAMAHRVWVWQCTVYSTCVHTNIQHCAGVYSPNANVGVPTKCWCQPILRSGCVYDIVVDIQMLLCICAHDLWVCYRASLIRSNHIQKEEWEKKHSSHNFSQSLGYHSVSLSPLSFHFFSSTLVERTSVRFIQYLLNHITCYLRETLFIHINKRTGRNYVRNGLLAVDGINWAKNVEAIAWKEIEIESKSAWEILSLLSFCSLDR